jgi:hypothetical protein
LGVVDCHCFQDVLHCFFVQARLLAGGGREAETLQVGGPHHRVAVDPHITVVIEPDVRLRVHEVSS